MTPASLAGKTARFVLRSVKHIKQNMLVERRQETENAEFQALNTRLREKIYTALRPELKGARSCALYDLPYYSNIGDSLIWAGEEHFLKSLGIPVIARCSIDTFAGKTLPESTVILCGGGGNFGDLWRRFQDFRLKIIQTYPKDKIIILPQSVFYKNIETMRQDADIFAAHKNLTICARDKESYAYLKKNFSNPALLMPDMAFCLEEACIPKEQYPASKPAIFIKRDDKEFVRGIDYAAYLPGSDALYTSDWNTISDEPIELRILQRLKGGAADIYARKKFLPMMVREGARFLGAYKKVYTTRLHAAILSCLLHIPCVLFDNSYGKNRNFYDTWLTECEQVKLAGDEAAIK